MKDEKGITITNAFQKILDESNHCVWSKTLATIVKSKGHKPNKIWVDKGSELYNRSMKSWLEKNAIEIYSTHNEGTYKEPEKTYKES